MIVYTKNSHCFQLQVVDKISPIGDNGDICVEVKEGNFGIVYAHSSTMLCATCQYGKASCCHIEYVSEILNSSHSDDMHPALQQFADLSEQKLDKPRPLPVCLSLVNIPFNVPHELQQVLQQSESIRFNIIEGVAQFIPTNQLHPCSMCHMTSWSTDVSLLCNTNLITATKVLLTKSK